MAGPTSKDRAIAFLAAFFKLDIFEPSSRSAGVFPAPGECLGSGFREMHSKLYTNYTDLRRSELQPRL